MIKLTHLFTRMMIGTLVLLVSFACREIEGDNLDGSPFDDLDAASLNWKIDVSLDQKGNYPRLHIRESFVMPRDRLLLSLPETYLRKVELYKRIEDLAVASPGVLLAHPKSLSTRILDLPKGEIATIEYYVRHDEPEPQKAKNIDKESFSAPIIRNDYFQFVASMALIYPVGISSIKSFPLELNWNLPTSFSVYNSYGAEKSTQNVNTDFDKLRDSFFVAGKNIRVHRETVRNKPVLVTMEGVWENISDNEFVTTVTSLLDKQRETFNDDNFPYFLVHLMAKDSDCGGNLKFAGTAHPNSFRAVFPNGQKCTLIPEMRQLISHELIHMWIGKKIRVGEARGHIDGKWFTEGFTDFLGRLMAELAGVIDEDEFFVSLNRQLEKYSTSSERNTVLAGLIDRMYRPKVSNRYLEELPYQQGEIMAWRLNARIKLATMFKNSLINVVQEMLADADRNGGFKKLTVAEVAEYFDRYSPGSFMEEYRKIVVGDFFLPPTLTKCRDVHRDFTTKFQTTPVRVAEPIYFYGRSQGECSRWLN